ncbi:hypothetical protein JI750_18330 [Flavobacterium sp. GN10]|uniref:Phytanoyl-CoA dioxygenase (PhyH) n=1 Tax=Flavobacterium tagetis TaxID=2801336 RepID=A0ABS1KHR5_9FLAO|nr:hypothetical protein [Flavobacterium tagetis]MBL0738859.1 hypothetical protein [Flavobacterium tagetis]
MLIKFLKKVSFRVHRNVHNVQLRDVLCAFFKVFLPKITISTGNTPLSIEYSEQKLLNDLNEDGFANLGVVLSDIEINSIKKKLEGLECYDTSQVNPTPVNLSSPGINVQLAHYKREDLIEIDEIFAIANDSRVLNVVSNYLGVKPTISNVNCWWSFGDRESAKDAQFYHRDLDDYKFVKMFFYLTDVDDNSGPHIYVKKSHRINKLLELRRFSDEEVVNTFDNQNILVLTEPKGSCFIEDTYGIHKGQLPVKGNRLLLQIQYSYLPLHVENYNPKKSDVLERMKFDKYINRLLFND